MTAQAIVRCRGNLCVCPVRVCMEPMRGIVSINYKHVPFALKYRLPRLLRVAIFWVANPRAGSSKQCKQHELIKQCELGLLSNVSWVY